MADSNWDNSGLPAPKKGLGTGAKIAIGCGVALLLALGGCAAFVGGIAGLVGKQMQAQEWPALRAVVTQLETDEGARAVYAAHPRLAVDHPSEAAWLAAVQGWRPKLEPLPAEPPSLFTGRISMNVSVSGGYRRSELGYRNGKGAMLSSRWENGRLLALEVN